MAIKSTVGATKLLQAWFLLNPNFPFDIFYLSSSFFMQCPIKQQHKVYRTN
jgi:hypothetical protein